MDGQLFVVDKIILIVYFFTMIAFGVYFRKKSSSSMGFMIANGRLPSWAVGLSILGTFVSSITFLAYPGQSYNFNWDALIFSFTLPIAAIVAVLFFIPLYRSRIKVSAYEYLEQRFGGWARVYGSVSFMFESVTRIGLILFLVSLVIHNLTGWSYGSIIIFTGIGVIIYTMLGGIEAVIWTDVVQVIILIGGALFATIVLIADIPGGMGTITEMANAQEKFSLGSWDFDLIIPTAWVVLFFGIMENLRNFGVDQNFVQRYQTVRTTREAAKSVWTAALMYIPLSMLFLFIGTALWVFYSSSAHELPAHLQMGVVGDKIFPHFIVTELPVGLRGILIAAIFAAAMSSVDSSLNCVSTLTLLDFYKRYKNPQSSEQNDLRLLRLYTIVWGVLGTLVGLAMIQVQSALETGWKLGGIAGGGVIGLFLLGLCFKRIKRWHAVVAVVASVISIMWATFARNLPESFRWFECTWNSRMIGVIGTITLLVVGILLSFFPFQKK